VDYISGLIGVYELKRIDYLREVFVWAYERSAARYSAVVQSLGEPDPFRLRLRGEIGESVREVVQQQLDKRGAARWIANHAALEIAEKDRARFIEVVESELLCLHEGNIARFRLRPTQFEAWQERWR